MTIAQRRILCSSLIGLAFMGEALAQKPVIASINNSADYTVVVAPGSLATIFGSNLATSTASASAIPLPFQMAGASVSVGGRPAPLLYVSPGQINAQMPYATPAGAATVTVTTNGATSATYQVFVVTSGAGLYGIGDGHGVIQNGDYTLNSASNPTSVGSTVVAYLTGIGGTSPSQLDGTAAPSSTLAVTPLAGSATIGDLSAPLQYLGLAPGFVGVAQANIQIPQLPTGEYPMTVSVDGHQSTSVRVSVAGMGQAFQSLNVLSLAGTVTVPNGVGQTLVSDVQGYLGGSLAVYKNYLYICGPPNITVFDNSNPLSPLYVGQFGSTELGGRGQGCIVNSAVSAPFMEVQAGTTDAPKIVTYDLGSPAQPKLLAQTSNTSAFAFRAFDGKTGFFGQNVFQINSSLSVVGTLGNVAAFDFSNPASPQLISLLSSSTTHPETDSSHLRLRLVVPQAGLLYAASTTASNTTSSGVAALDVFDTSNPASIQGLAQVQVTGSAILNGFSVNGSQLIAVGETQGFQSPGYKLANGLSDFPYLGKLTVSSFDITNPRAPILQSTITAGLQPNSCGGGSSLLGGGFIAISCSAPDLIKTGPGLNNSLLIVDARNPLALTVHTVASIQGLGGMIVNNGYLYAATTTGANIYKIQLP